MNTHEKSISQLFKDIQGSDKGLSQKEAEKRAKHYGENKLQSSRASTSRFKIFADQWKSPLILILVVAGIISLALHEYLDAIVIWITVGINVLIGFIQEFKADKALEKLHEIVTYKAIVLRDGQKVQIESDEIVPGDILYLSAGNKIQADGRIIELNNLEVDESVLTGESEPVKKKKHILKGSLAVGDQVNMVFRGTTVVNGTATVLVTSIGLETQLGSVASLITSTGQEKTPLQEQLEHLSKILAVVVLAISGLLFLFGYLTHKSDYGVFQLFETSIAVAVAAIPEGLVIALTVILAVGMQFILKRKALVRKLVAAETLGSVSVICTDKTGTLTEGKMKVSKIITIKHEVTREELSQVVDNDSFEDVQTALRIGTLCNNAILDTTTENGDIHFLGDMTERALAEASAHVGLEKRNLEDVYTRQDEITFSSKRKYMATLHHVEHESRIFAKGAPEVIMKKVGYIEKNGKQEKISKKDKEFFENTQEDLTSRGLRVLALAYKKADTQLSKINEKDVSSLVLVGLVALRDPLRKDVKETLDKARKAGIHVVMITGDHMSTASAIGRDIGMDVTKDSVFNGEQLRSMSHEELKNQIEHISIFSRVDPKDKIHIVQALKANGETVAMTGDGVNDAPAIKAADIGIALGSGTDVAKETSDMVLLDNRFSTIVAAIEEGRSIYQNIKKVVLYLLGHSFTEVILITGSIILGLPLAVLPAQILWVNLIEDSFPSMALSFDPGDKENMLEKPRKRSESIVDGHMKIMIAIITLVAGGALLGLFVYLHNVLEDIALVRTIIFATLSFNSLLFIYPVRSFRHMIWKINPFNNHYITLSVILGFVLILLSVYWQPLQILLQTVPLTLSHWGLVVLFSAIDVLLLETMKFIFIVRSHRFKTA